MAEHDQSKSNNAQLTKKSKRLNRKINKVVFDIDIDDFLNSD